MPDINENHDVGVTLTLDIFCNIFATIIYVVRITNINTDIEIIINTHCSKKPLLNSRVVG